MEQEQLREFARLQDEALARLRAGVNRKGYLCQFRAITIPSLEDSLAHEILLPAGSHNVSRSDAMPAIAAKTVWKRSIDAEKFITPVVRLKHGLGSLEPTIEVVQGCIPLEPVTNLLSKAHAASLPAHVGQHSFGVDGTSYELILGGHFMEARFRWWHKVPTGWEPLWTLSAEIKVLVDNAIAASS